MPAPNRLSTTPRRIGPQDDDALVQANVRLPPELWNAVRKLAIDLGTSAQQCVADALSAYLKAYRRAA